MLKMPAPLSTQQQPMQTMDTMRTTATEDPSTNGQQHFSVLAAQHLLKAPLAAVGPLANLPAVPPQCGPPTISLALLIDFAIHWNYRQFEILSELNSKKKETDRKISVVEFAHNTRLIFVRLLSIVRWLKSAKKFEPLASIRYLLDEQATRYVETADRLVEIARNELPNARLPAFQVAQAVDVLTLGSFPRLPQNIKDCFIPPAPLNSTEQRLTLRQLNQVIEFYLAREASQLSPRIQHITVQNGTAILLVTGEFEMTLTRLGDDPSTRWALLNIRILVESTEVGEGQGLVHPLQVNFLHQIVQEKFDNSNKPLLEAYTVLHWFCRSLQLDIIYCQALQIAKMSRSKGSDTSNYIRVDEYNDKECRLVISYWLRRTESELSKLTSQHRLTIFGDKNNPDTGLKIRHKPPNADLPNLSHDQGQSIQRLLNETILFRCQERLLVIKQLLEAAHRTLSQNHLKQRPKPSSSSPSPSTSTRPPPPSDNTFCLPSSSSIFQSGHSLLTISYPLVLIGDCHSDECITLAINTFTGLVVAQVEILGQRDEIRELEHQLNFSPAILLHSSSLQSITTIDAIARSLARLRILVIIERLNRALVGVQVNPVSEAQAAPLMTKLKSLPPDRRIFQFIKDEQFYLVITFVPDEQLGVRVDFHLFSASESRLTLLELDVEQIIRDAPLPRLNKGHPLQKSESWTSFCQRNKPQKSDHQRKNI